MADSRSEHLQRTRFLRPVEPISFNSQEMFNSLLTAVVPGMVTSINQLHGDRKGVVRLTCKTPEAAAELEGKVTSRKVHIKNVRLATVTESGQFVKVTLQDVPEYLSSADIEKELREFGNVVHVKREFFEYQEYRIENEVRHALFSTLQREIPSRILIDGHQVFVSYKHAPLGVAKHHNEAGELLISQPKNIPKYVMSSINGPGPGGDRQSESSNSKTPSEHDSDVTRERDRERYETASLTEREREAHERDMRDRQEVLLARPTNLFSTSEVTVHRPALRRRSLDHDGLQEYHERWRHRSKTPDCETNI